MWLSWTWVAQRHQAKRSFDLGCTFLCHTTHSLEANDGNTSAVRRTCTSLLFKVDNQDGQGGGFPVVRAAVQATCWSVIDAGPRGPSVHA
jgi:hypothetical protein